MAALVGYASSDEDEVQDSEQQGSKIKELHNQPSSVPPQSDKGQAPIPDLTTPGTAPDDAQALAPGPQLPPEGLDEAPILGPSLPESGDRVDTEATPEPADAASRPLSPYSANRALIRELTLPAVPNLDVPPSPPGSPPRSLPGLTAKFETFLELKRKKGTHFNARLAQSTAMRNPALMDKLLGFVGLEDPMTAAGAAEKPPAEAGNNMADQYITILPPDIWDPTTFPRWAFRDELRKSQEKVQKEREAQRSGGRREAVEFVPASAPTTTSTTTTTTSAGSMTIASERKSRSDKP